MRAKVIKYVPKLRKIPVIRRVLAQGGQFVCGICRRTHPALNSAYACLQTCWDEFLGEPPVARRRGRGGIVFRCRLCGKHFGDIEPAVACAERCLNRSDAIFTELIEAEQMTNLDQNGKQISLRSWQSLALNRKTIPRWSFKRKAAPAAIGTRPEKVAKAGQTTGEVAAPIDKTDTMAQAPDTRRKKTGFKQAWRRDDAKYVCEFCGTYFYTKMETNACFDAHFDADGLEIIPP